MADAVSGMSKESTETAEDPLGSVTPTSAIETLYLRNLNEKVSVNKLKHKLQTLFSTYGKVLQITAHKNLKMKGQAFITFDSAKSAITALNKLQSFVIFDKRVQIQFSKSNSDSHYKLDSQDDGEIPEIKERKRRKVEREAQVESRKRKLETTSSNSTSLSAAFGATPKKPKLSDWKSLPPNSILLIQNLPETTTVDQLNDKFESLDGYITIRHVKIRHLAFIEFDNEAQATEALSKFDAQLLAQAFSPETILTYARK